MKQTIYLFFCILIFSFCQSLPLFSGPVIRGIIIDRKSKEAIKDVNIIYKGKATTLLFHSDDKGEFCLTLPSAEGGLHFSRVGYKKRSYRLPLKLHRLDTVQMELLEENRGEVSVVHRRKKYVKRNNLALALVQEAIQLRKYNSLYEQASYSYGLYSEMQVMKLDHKVENGFLGADSSLTQRWLSKNTLSGEEGLLMSFREELFWVTKNRNEAENRRLVSRRITGLEESIDDDGSLANNLNEIFHPIDIYKDDIHFLRNRFPSPLSQIVGANFYEYYLRDTSVIRGEPCVRINFKPMNDYSQGLSGFICLSLSSRAILKVQLLLPKQANINWVEGMRIEQDFEEKQMPSGRKFYVLTKEKIASIFTMEDFFLPMRLSAQLTRRYIDPSTPALSSPPFSLALLKKEEGELTPVGTEEFWASARPDSLPQEANQVEDLMRYARSRSLYRIFTEAMRVGMTGYLGLPLRKGKKQVPKIDLGPVNSFVSGNAIEGLRLGFGAMSTAQIHSKLFAKAFLAYGFRDKEWKYNASLTYSFNSKAYHALEFPQRNVSVKTQYDLYTPGQVYWNDNKDNLLGVAGTTSNVDRVYIRSVSLKTDWDLSRDWSVSILFNYERLRPTESLKRKHYLGFDFNFLALELLWSPGRVPYNGRSGAYSSFNIASTAPIFRFNHRFALKGFLSNKEYYARSEFIVDHRLWLSAFGSLQIFSKMGLLWKKPSRKLLLEAPPINQSYFLQRRALQLLNPFEYECDKWALLLLRYDMGGLLLNHIPFIQKLGLREVLSFNNLLAKSGVNPFGYRPRSYYAEWGVGLTNIFHFLGIEYYQRITPLYTTEQPKWTLRASAVFNF